MTKRFMIISEVMVSMKLETIGFEFLELSVEIHELGTGNVLDLFTDKTRKVCEVHSVHVTFGDFLENELRKGFLH